MNQTKRRKNDKNGTCKINAKEKKIKENKVCVINKWKFVTNELHMFNIQKE